MEPIKRMFLIQLNAQWWIKSYSETEAIEHLVKVIYRDKFLDKHHPAFQCIGIRDVDEFDKKEK